jgi:hypothetical protein
MLARALLLVLLALTGATGGATCGATRGGGSAARDDGGSPIVAATFYAWYDASTGAHLRSPDGREVLRHHLPDARLVRPDSPEWFAQEIEAAAAAGIDVLLVANVPAPAGLERSLPALRTALETTAPRLKRPLRVALLLDPWFVAVDRAGGEGAGPVAKLDLGDPFQLTALMSPVERFFTGIPRAFQATIEGAPLLVVGSNGAVGKRPDDLFEQMERSVEGWTGKAPWLVVDQSWGAAGHERWRAGSALLGAQVDPSVVTLGPGYDGRLLLGGSSLLRLRDDGETYEAQWQAALAAKPRLVVLESWNQLHDGTAIAPTIEHGDRYVELTRQESDLLRAGEMETRPAPRVASSLVLAESFAPDRELALADDAEFRPSAEAGGVRLVPPPFDGEGAARAARLEFARDESGAPRLLVTPAEGAASGKVAFDVSDVFRGVAPSTCEIAVDATPLAATARVTLRTAESTLVEGELDAKRPIVATVGRSIPSRFELECSGPISIRSIALHRRDRRLPESRLGVSDAHWFDLPAAERLTAARKLGARWFRFEVPWSELAPSPESLDVERIGVAVEAVHAADLEPLVALVDPPRWMKRVAANPDAVAQVVAAIARRCAGKLRLLELFPGSNVPGEFARQPDAQGAVRVLRAAAKAARAVDPSIAVVLGGVRGPDRVWLQTIDELHEHFAYDAAMLLADDESGAIESRSFAHELERLAVALRSGGDAGKPWFLELGAATTPSPLLAAERRAMLPAVIAAAWRRLGCSPTPIHLLDEPELPRVRGLTAAHARELLEAAGIGVEARSLSALIADLQAQRVRTLLLAGGEIVPRELLPLLPGFVDRGGLLVTLGGAPFRRTTARLEEGLFEVEDDASSGLSLRDDLRISLARFRPELDELPGVRSWKSGLTVPGLAESFAPTPKDGALFTARTGLPRNDHGFHHYEPLLVVDVGGREVGDVATLIAFAGAREGALLLIGADAADPGRSPGDQAAALRVGLRVALESKARVVFWRGLADPAAGSDGGALFDAEGAPRDAAAAFARFAAKRDGGK